MLFRNIVELIIIIPLLFCTLIIYIYAKRKEKDVESELVIRNKSDILEKLEKAPDLGNTGGKAYDNI